MINMTDRLQGFLKTGDELLICTCSELKKSNCVF